MKRIFNGKVTVKNFIVAMLSAHIIFESVGSMSQIAYANGDENTEQTAQQTEKSSETAAENNEERNENSSSEESEAKAEETQVAEAAAETATETPATDNTETHVEETTQTTETETTQTTETETTESETTETTQTTQAQVVEEPEEPEKPVIEGEVNNDKIRQYNSGEFSVSDTYSVEEAAEKTGNKVTVIIRHYFEDIDKEYSEEFEIDENDIITLNSASAPLENTQAGWAQFYLGTDDAHTMGYWYNNGSILYENAKYVQNGWNAGESFTISYKDGINHIHDDPTIEINFNYAWQQLRTYKTYNVPVEPTLVQNEYTPNIMEMLAAPTKKAYLGYLSLMDLLADPDPVIPTPTPGSDPTPDPQPTPDPEPTPDPQPTPDPEPTPDQQPTPDPEPTPDPTPVVTPATVVTTIADDQTPLAAAPAQEGAQVLGAKRVRAEGAVLGARRGNTGDETKSAERGVIIFIAALGIISLLAIKKEKEEA
ncbi:MAG: hypothetical protein K6F75_03125 [Butyrivibrio sp.]|nr:hypothetical protein [Butyrivibrio sp.]